MIVLDEQLLGRNLEQRIAAWYPGAVRFITDLRPGTVIKDDAIPMLLREQSQATFVTINEQDFWRTVAIDDRFCVVCFALPDARADELVPLLRALLQRPEFSTKAQLWARLFGSHIRRSAITRLTTEKFKWSLEAHRTCVSTPLAVNPVMYDYVIVAMPRILLLSVTHLALGGRDRNLSVPVRGRRNAGEHKL